MRRIRSTFLLRCVVLSASVGIFVVVLQLSLSLPRNFTIGTILFLIMFWGLGVEAGLLPYLLEHILVRRAKRSSEKVNSLWFVDIDQKKKQQFEAHPKATSDNPTIR